MPGITGIFSGEAGSRLPALERELFPARPGMQRAAGGTERFACGAWSRHEESGVFERAGTVLAFEGWLFEGPPGGQPLLPWLLDRFEESGPAFVATLSGSFQIALHRAGTTWLATDPAGSRRLFFTTAGGELAFSPEVGPLALLAGGGWDPANLVQFLVSGRFFAGETLLPRVLQLLPGEVLTHRAGEIERRRYFELSFSADPEEPTEVAEPGLLAAFQATLDAAVERHLSRARRPVFLLSGGYDSRYLYQTAARLSADPSRLFSALWGERMDEPGSDNWTAQRVAARYGARHRTLPWRAAALPGQFKDMFRAHSGMTEMAFTHADELAVFATLAEEDGCLWAIRGDECFGPKGSGARDADEALAQAGMGRVDRLPGAGEWLSGGGGEELLDAHRCALDARLAGLPAAPDDLRDTLYGRERLPAFLQHHNYHKLHFLEMSNPFLDPEVLRFWSVLPARERIGKALFCRAYERAFGDPADPPDPPIAAGGNGIDWPAALRHDPDLAAWVRAGLEGLPVPLSSDFFLGQLDAVLAGREAAGGSGVAPFKLVARAFVLGHWRKTWAVTIGARGAPLRS